MGRRPVENDYGLPTLTFAQAARVLGIREGEFKTWVMERVNPSKGQWSEWSSGARPVPEKLLRLYLVCERGERVAAVPPPQGGLVEPPTVPDRAVEGRRPQKRASRTGRKDRTPSREKRSRCPRNGAVGA